MVTDQVGLSIPGATVTASAENTATTRVTVTDRQGLAELRALQPSAQYVVTVELEGFQMTRQADVLVRVGQTASTEMTLTVGNVTATVVVTAASPVVDVTSAVVAEDITLDLTEAVPNIRDTVFDGGLYTSLAGSLSGLTAGGLIAGDFFSTRRTAVTTPTSSEPWTGCRTGRRSTRSMTRSSAYSCLLG